MIRIVAFVERLGSLLMIFVLKIIGAKIGKNTFISFNSRIISKDIQIGDDCFIKGNAKIKGKRIKIGDNCIISDGCYITGSDSFSLGDKSYIGKFVRINLSKEVTIGSDVGLAEGSKIFTHGFFPPIDYGYPVTYAPVRIGDNVWISSNSIILPRVTIGNDVIIGPGSVITKSIATDSIINGNPARFVTNTSKLRSQKPFLLTMEEVFKDLESIKLIIRDEAYSLFDFNTGSKMYIIDGSLIGQDFPEIKKDDIILFKFMKRTNDLRKTKYYWFDLDEREMTARKNKEVQLIQDVLRANGIRLVKDYSN